MELGEAGEAKYLILEVKYLMEVKHDLVSTSCLAFLILISRKFRSYFGVIQFHENLASNE